MAKADKVENKDQKVEKSSKKSNKSSYSKKKKIKKNILNGIAYVQSTFNNTIISIADTNGNVISWASAGQKGFKGSRKSTPYAAQIAADAAASKAMEYGMKTLSVEVKGPGSGRETALRALQARGFKILSIKDTTPYLFFARRVIAAIPTYNTLRYQTKTHTCDRPLRGRDRGDQQSAQVAHCTRRRQITALS